MIDFILLILAGVGLSHILADSSIASWFKYKLLYKEVGGKPQRRFNGKRSAATADVFVKMLNCHQCNGFWSGLVVFALYYFSVYPLLWAFAISLLSPLWAAVYVYVMMLSEFEEVEDEE